MALKGWKQNLMTDKFEVLTPEDEKKKEWPAPQ